MFRRFRPVDPMQLPSSIPGVFLSGTYSGLDTYRES